jgi:tetratricopeptide (TPR) repeat protein
MKRRALAARVCHLLSLNLPTRKSPILDDSFMGRLSSKNASWRRIRWRRTAVVFFGIALFCAAAPPASREWQFRRHLRAARIAIDRFVADNAVIELTEAEKLKPSSAQVQYLLGVANRKAGHLDDCRPHLNKALELGWPAKEVRFQLLLLTFQAGDRHSEAEIKQILALPMADYVAEDTYEALALGYLSEYRISSAETVIDHWLDWRPNCVRARLLRAEVFGASRLHQEQIAQFEEVLAIEPDNYVAHLGMAHNLLDEHRVEAALEEYRWCHKQLPGDLSAPLGIAACYKHQGKLSEAAQVLRELLEEPLLRDQRGHVAGELGKLLRQTGDVQEAISLLTESVDLNPYDPEAEYALAMSLAKVGRREEAERHSARSKELQHLRQQLIDTELVMLNQPNDAHSRYEVGLVLAKLGNPKASAAMMLAALRWDPRHTGAHAELAKYYRDIGRDDLAQEHEAMAAEVAAASGGGL